MCSRDEIRASESRFPQRGIPVAGARRAPGRPALVRQRRAGWGDRPRSLGVPPLAPVVRFGFTLWTEPGCTPDEFTRFRCTTCGKEGAQRVDAFDAWAEPHYRDHFNAGPKEPEPEPKPTTPPTVLVGVCEAYEQVVTGTSRTALEASERGHLADSLDCQVWAKRRPLRQFFLEMTLEDYQRRETIKGPGDTQQKHRGRAA